MVCRPFAGHCDVKKLRRENDQLRREIWNLRDEYDRLDSLLKAKQEREDEEYEEVTRPNMDYPVKLGSYHSNKTFNITQKVINVFI